VSGFGKLHLRQRQLFRWYSNWKNSLKKSLLKKVEVEGVPLLSLVELEGAFSKRPTPIRFQLFYSININISLSTNVTTNACSDCLLQFLCVWES